MQRTEFYISGRNRSERPDQAEPSEGYADGRKNAKEEYGNSKGIAHVHKATKEQIEKHGLELSGWCDCGKPIEGRWAGWINFCPWCGKIIEWEDFKYEKQQ